MNLKVKEVAKKKGVALEDIAKKIGITYTSLYRRIDNPKLSTLEEIASILNCGVAELLEAPEGFMHLYDDKTGEWLGIIPRPVVANRGVLQEEEEKK
ncbi:helix-turn-helix domain-containing protein [Capnocytophaga canis]|uniref:helix-turn-helix domain-containing protein n=1 Tax=Capnocytophaga canis TaxID=1848903 RepID=UPI00210022C7|nr:helix-turn-helix transcriptional regulator [Capnocytophaga canis]